MDISGQIECPDTIKNPRGDMTKSLEPTNVKVMNHTMTLVGSNDPLPNIETPFFNDNIICMLLVKSNSSRERSTAFLDRDDSIPRRTSFPSENGLKLFTECAHLIASFFKDVGIDGKKKECTPYIDSAALSWRGRLSGRFPGSRRKRR